jgi:hypothetical protein
VLSVSRLLIFTFRSLMAPEEALAAIGGQIEEIFYFVNGSKFLLLPLECGKTVILLR